MSSRTVDFPVIATQTVKVIELPEHLWPAQKLAAFLGVELKTLYQLNTYGTGPRFYKVGRECRYDPRDVVAWLESKASRPTGVSA